MNYGLSDQVRAMTLEKYVYPAIQAGKTQFSVAVRDLIRELRTMGFPAKNWPQVCSAIQSQKFLRENGLEIEAVDGPPSKQSTTVVVRYRVAQKLEPGAEASEGERTELRDETPEERAHRLTGKLFGLLKDEIAEMGGAKAFMRWVRSEDEDEAGEDAA